MPKEKSSKLFLKLGVLTNDPNCFLLAAIAKEEESQLNKAKFNFDTHPEEDFMTDFRFEKNDLLRLHTTLDLPVKMRVAKNGTVFTSIEGN